MELEREIFRRGSTTYYFSSRFFPSAIRADVFKLYSFVRVADNYVDDQPAKPTQLLALEAAWTAAWANTRFSVDPLPADSIDDRVVKNMVDVARRYKFDPAWVDAFFAAMKADISPRPFATLTDTLGYTYGSAEVVGLMMARLMGLPAAAQSAAALQGRAMQFINFIRDIAEDNTLGRQYFPLEDLARFGLANLTHETALLYPKAFSRFVHYELDRYEAWQTQASRGFVYIPKRYRVALRTAVDMYGWTARQIRHDPLIVFERKVKPAKWRVLTRAAQRVTNA